MYKLFLDKSETFECSINLEGASLTKSMARILIESDDYNLIFNGTIDSNGHCEIPIRKLKGLLGENTTGNIKLEVIAEDTYFTPWESTYSVDAAKKVTVEVKQQTTSKLQKPKVAINETKLSSNIKHIKTLSKIFIREGIDLDTIPMNKEKIGKIVELYTTKYKLHPKSVNYIIDGVLKQL